MIIDCICFSVVVKSCFSVLVKSVNNGGAERDRTDDLLRARQALSQLSYTPNPYGEQQWQAVPTELHPQPLWGAAMAGSPR